MTAEPLIIEFEVGVAPAQAFDTWTQRCATWWPRSHTMSGDPSAISFEPRSGGRIVEHAPGGDHEWGEVLDWDPPDRLRCLWHPFFDRSEATELDITFRPVATGTAIRLEQRGWGAPRRGRHATANPDRGRVGRGDRGVRLLRELSATSLDTHHRARAPARSTAAKFVFRWAPSQNGLVVE